MAKPPGVDGVRETLDALQEFSRATGQNVVRRALLKSAQPVVDAARGYAPDDPQTAAPDLRNSIVASVKLTRRAQQSTPRINEVEIFIGPSSSAGRHVLNYAALQEFGTVNHPPHPYLRPAWDSRKAEVEALFAKSLALEYEKTADRIAARFFKKG